MKISKIYIYPVKSLRGVSLPSAQLTRHGFPYDRSFMLLRDHEDASKSPKGTRFENMAVAYFPQMCLFTTDLTFPTDDDPLGGQLRVTYTNPNDKSTKTLEVPLQPDTSELANFDVDMHQSATKSFRMPPEYCDWFSSCFGFNVVFVYIGPHRRQVLGNLSPNSAIRNPIKAKERQEKSWSASIFSTIASNLPSASAILGGSANSADDQDYAIQFADVCPYLLVSETSLANVSARLPEGQEMDITKFRPNIILAGAPEAWEEDFWAQLRISSADGHGSVKLFLTANCLRCQSINVDYETGDYGKGPAGEVLKKLQADRRIDTGHKYAPGFGRYGFLTPESVEGRKETFVVAVGDGVEVEKRNAERTVFKYPGIGQTKKEEWYPV